MTLPILPSTTAATGSHSAVNGLYADSGFEVLVPLRSFGTPYDNLKSFHGAGNTVHVLYRTFLVHFQVW
jgi:hypothetical protein